MSLIAFPRDDDNPAVLSFRSMRRSIGILGMALPLVLLSWSLGLTAGHFLLDSISSYYHTNLRDLFVGILCAVSFFLFAYHGYNYRDFIAFKIAALAALGVAFFPAYIKSRPNPWIHVAPNVSDATNTMHYISAAVLFLTLACISLFLFTKTAAKPAPGGKRAKLPRQKARRNAVYIACGSVMLLCIALMAVVDLLPPASPILALDPVFWIETLALFAFGISWLVKGDTLFRDKPEAKTR